MAPRFPFRLCWLIPALLGALGAAGGAAFAGEAVRLVRVWPEYRAEASFVRIGEYFGGAEGAPERIVRSRPGERAGFYFLARVKSVAAEPGARLSVEYWLPGEERAREQVFPVELPAGSQAFLAGLTGADWPGAAVRPTAWRLRVLAPDGRVLAEQRSFLWSLPAAEAGDDASGGGQPPR